VNRNLALLSLIVVGLCLPAILVFVWIVTPAPEPLPPRPRVAPVPQHLLPQIPLPSGSDPESLALRRSLLNGERIYQRLCYNCHGRQGKGDMNEYMESVGHKPADHTDLAKMQQLSDWEFFLALRDGVKDKRGWLTMPPWESLLTPTEMWDVIAYVRRLPLATPPSNQPLTLPDAQQLTPRP
jgi:mono/diheme cytochrome c family protein